MNILLINPWITDFAAYDFWVKPLGLLYLGAFLRKRGHRVRLVDCMDRFQDGSGINIQHEMRTYNTGKFHREIIEKPGCLSHVPRHFCRYGIPLETFKKRIRTGWKPDIVLVTCIMTYWYHSAFAAISLIHDLLPGIPVLLGGIYATLCEDHARSKSGADAVISGSSPSKIIDIVELVGGDHGDGSPVPDSFDDWPEPLWDVYSTLKSAMVLTTRGCPLNCTICASKFLYKGFEQRNPVTAAETIIELAKRGVEDIAFCDDAILIDPEHHALPLFETLARANVPVRLHSPNGLHIREITPEVARLMKQAGMVTVRLSLETASEERLEDFSHKVSRDEFRRAVGALYSAGYTPDDLGAYIIVGLPGQTYQEVLDTVKFVLDTGVKVRPALFSPVPHTVEFGRAVQAGMIHEDDDPVLQNKTLRTVDWWEKNRQTYKEFKTYLNNANSLVAKGKNL